MHVLAGLRNVHPDLPHARRRRARPQRASGAAARRAEPRTDLPESPALSILADGSDSFAGRQLGVLLTDGADAGRLAQLQSAAQSRQAN